MVVHSITSLGEERAGLFAGHHFCQHFIRALSCGLRSFVTLPIVIFTGF